MLTPFPLQVRQWSKFTGVHWQFSMTQAKLVLTMTTLTYTCLHIAAPLEQLTEPLSPIATTLSRQDDRMLPKFNATLASLITNLQTGRHVDQ